MGCITRVGCLGVLFVTIGGGLWLYGEQLPDVVGRLAGRATRRVTGDTTQVDPDARIPWASLTDATANGAQSVARLGRSNGPAYVTLGAGDLAGFLAAALARQLPRSSVSPQVAVVGDRVLLRAEVDLRDFAGQGAFGSVVGAAMTGRDTLRMSGTLDAIHPGLAQYRVRSLRLGSVEVPPRVVPSLVGTLRGRVKIDSLAPNALPIPMPRYVSDVRVVNGRVTLYAKRQALPAGRP